MHIKCIQLNKVLYPWAKITVQVDMCKFSIKLEKYVCIYEIESPIWEITLNILSLEVDKRMS